jgi:hypothetical protein
MYRDLRLIASPLDIWQNAGDVFAIRIICGIRFDSIVPVIYSFFLATISATPLWCRNDPRKQYDMFPQMVPPNGWRPGLFSAYLLGPPLLHKWIYRVYRNSQNKWWLHHLWHKSLSHIVPPCLLFGPWTWFVQMHVSMSLLIFTVIVPMFVIVFYSNSKLQVLRYK